MAHPASEEHCRICRYIARCCCHAAVTILILLSCSNSNAQHDPFLETLFYKNNGNQLFWFSPGKAGIVQELQSMLANAGYYGLDNKEYSGMDSDTKLQTLADTIAADHYYTVKALNFLTAVLKGDERRYMVGYDELSARAAAEDREQVVQALLGLSSSRSFMDIAQQLEPDTREYVALKNALGRAILNRAADTADMLATALNAYRWIYHFHFSQYIVVNIVSGQLVFFRDGRPVLDMKVVTGKPATPTPRFAAYCNQVIFYPYWNVPNSIALKEILPMCKKNAAILDVMNMQVLDQNGKVLDHHKINWKSMDKHNFRYRFRQSTGCDNALGLIKFNLTSPYSVYLHDTNVKQAFGAKKRYFSHGCIRIERPLQLAELILDTTISPVYLNTCLRQQLPVVHQLVKPIPVFVVYYSASARDSILSYGEDVYHLLSR